MVVRLKKVVVAFPSLAHIIKAVSKPLLFKSVKTLPAQKQRLSASVERIDVIY